MARPVKCARCGRDNDASFAFCLDCGQALRTAAAGAGPRHCTACGAALQAGFKFCALCGHAAPPPGRETPPVAPRVQPPGATPVTSLQVTVVEAAPRLCAVRHDGLPGLVLELSRPETLCGRTEGELRLADDPSVSPRHARFLRNGRNVQVEDLGSVNGTYLRLRAAHPVSVGEELRIGRQLVRLEPLPRPAPAPGGEQGGRVWGSADSGATLRLAQLLEGGGIAEIFPLRPGENMVGRDAGDVTFPGDRYVSARHAIIRVEPGGVTITDLGSSNGSFRKVMGTTDLVPGDQLLLGAQLLQAGRLVRTDRGRARVAQPNDFSFCSCSSLQRMQRVVTGRASRRLAEISSSHFSQMPKVPVSTRASALSILESRNFSRSRSRKIIDWLYSLEAWSISSGRSSVSKLASSVSVFFADASSWRFDSSSIVLNRFRSFLFKRLPPPRALGGRERPENLDVEGGTVKARRGTRARALTPPSAASILAPCRTAALTVSS